MIITDRQIYLKSWLCDKIGLVPSERLVCIGNTGNDGKLLGVVGYDGFNGASIQMHSAGQGNWVTRAMLFAAFDYPFRVCGASMVLGMIPSGNVQAIKFNTHIGFKVETVINGAHPDGSLWIMSMTRKECRFFKETSNGQEIFSTAAGCT